ncbi:GNAT family acetyltransferase Nat4, putative [Trichophyton verrucosum HKI 0517]|uniref:N-alpha-acetyltransferase 40 n=1 Tax=Trichophyton verrucosum (strain HKI 0517) TaxID=663202 RepID=D4DDK3_TRIVH|nr:GNAT family acetyltransferase Nat4, putative [Trichophyton verrucosum HKI 0517]EFE40070.1 GNAT family acetyltransferase Nat4, putative [Trichophyton verrucosum HKI 0517]
MLIKKRKRNAEPTLSAETPQLTERPINIAKTRIKVESINSAPFSEFIHRYIPPYALDLTIRLPTTSSDDTHGEPGHISYSLQFYTAASIPEPYMTACYDLIYLTSSAAYKQSASGWSARKKKLEMKLLDMRYMVLVLKKNNETEGTLDMPTVGGFLSFMVTEEDEMQVLYCYEIHLAPEVQHKGVGKQLLQIFEDIGKNIGLQKGMLTVFKSNTSAIRFYERLGFTEDANSPKPAKLRNGKMKEYDYMIMSQPFTNDSSEKMDISTPDFN